ncbi:MAG: DUF5777 family beta-barrel protein [bacterium]
MKKQLSLIVALLFGFGLIMAQDEEAPKKKVKERPVSGFMGSSVLIDDQTSWTPAQKVLEMHIQHRFGLIKENGLSDLYGIYAPSANTRMALNYSILDNLVVSYGITRKNMYSDFGVKWTFLRQSRSGKIPLNVGIYANMAIDGRNKTVYEGEEEYQFLNRLSYFSQLIVGRKFTDWFTLELHASFTHYNAMPADEVSYKGWDHDFGWGGHARFKFSSQSSFIIMFSAPVYIHSLSENYESQNPFKSNFGFGYEVATASHAFQIFVTTSNGILPQDIYMYNNSDWTKGEFRFGFNITRLWEF